jgi:hypothetical protein
MRPSMFTSTSTSAWKSPYLDLFHVVASILRLWHHSLSLES